MDKIVAILLLSFIAPAQDEIPIRVFHKHIQICQYVGTTEEDYTIELFSDSTVKLNLYRSNYRDQYDALVKETYFGKYVSIGDTIKVSELLSSIEKKCKRPLKLEADNKHPLVLRRLSNIVFVVQGNLLLADDVSWSGLCRSSASQALMLANRFNEWGKATVYHAQEEALGIKLFKRRSVPY
jgi:hypothetical protein